MVPQVEKIILHWTPCYRVRASSSFRAKSTWVRLSDWNHWKWWRNQRIKTTWLWMLSLPSRQPLQSQVKRHSSNQILPTMESSLRQVWWQTSIRPSLESHLNSWMNNLPWRKKQSKRLLWSKELRGKLAMSLKIHSGPPPGSSLSCLKVRRRI